MKATTQFIEDAIKGGFLLEYEHVAERDHHTNEVTQYNEAEILIDPFAWRAVGNIRGWASMGCSYCLRKILPLKDGSIYSECPEHGLLVEELYAAPVWLTQMHRFIDHLAEDKDVELALRGLEEIKIKSSI